MTKEELNTALYKKMFAEQEAYRDWLKQQPVDDILRLSYEYTAREDILLSLEYNDLSAREAALLLESDTPLADVFKRFESSENGYMEIIWDCVENYTRDLVKERDLLEAPVYLQTASYARDHDELSLFRASHKANIQCSHAISDAIRANYADNILDTKTIFSQILGQFGSERMQYILAATVRHQDWDARYSHSNKEWAKTIPMGEKNRLSEYSISPAHPGLIDLLVTHARKEFAVEAERKPSVREKLKRQPSNNAPKISANKLEKEDR